jgi:fumarylacetoacetate (FAA) hydrolase family protein
MVTILPEQQTGCFVGRVWRGDVGGPSLVAVRDGRVIDITCRAFPTMRDLLEQDDPAALVEAADGEELGELTDIALGSVEPKQDDRPPSSGPGGMLVESWPLRQRGRRSRSS